MCTPTSTTRYGKLFYVYVRAEDLANWSGKREFLRLTQEALEDYDAEEALYDLISDACIAILRVNHPHSVDPPQAVHEEADKDSHALSKKRKAHKHLSSSTCTDQGRCASRRLTAIHTMEKSASQVGGNLPYRREKCHSGVPGEPADKVAWLMITPFNRP
jgi:hypothetical protein